MGICSHFLYAGVTSADEDIDSTFPTNVVVSSDGSCLWVPPGTTTCSSCCSSTGTHCLQTAAVCGCLRACSLAQLNVVVVIVVPRHSVFSTTTCSSSCSSTGTQCLRAAVVSGCLRACSSARARLTSAGFPSTISCAV